MRTFYAGAENVEEKIFSNNLKNSFATKTPGHEGEKNMNNGNSSPLFI